jgi:WD40 repeat protein
VCRLRGHARHVVSVAFRPDGKVLATADEGRAVRLWDAATGKELPPPAGHGWAGRCVAFSPDGRLLALAGAPQDTLSLWDVATGTRLPRFGKDPRFGYTAAFCPDGKTLAVVGSDGILRLWDVATGRLLRTAGGLPDGVSRSGGIYPLAFSPDGRLVAAQSYHGEVLGLWEVATGKQRVPGPGHDGPVQLLAASPDGRRIVSRQELDPTLWLWDTATGRPLHALRGHTTRVAAVAFSPDGKLLASGGNSRDRTLRLWDVRAGREVRRLPLDPGTDVTSLAFAPDGRTLAAGAGQGGICLWDVAAGQVVRRFQAYRPGADADGDLNFWPVTALAYSPNGRLLASGCLGGQPFRLWDAATGRLVRELPVPGAAASPLLTFSADGRTLLTWGRRQAMSLWEVASGGERGRLRSPPKADAARCCALAPDGRVLAWTVYPYEAVQVWDPFAGRPLGQVRGHRAPVTAVLVLPDGRLVTGSQDTTLLVWQGFPAAAPRPFTGRRMPP